MSEQRPREWVLPLKTLIINDGKGLSALARQNRKDETRVIEFSAYQKAIEALKSAHEDVEKHTAAGWFIENALRELGELNE